MKLPKLKSHLLLLMSEGKEITVRWNCGGDEALLAIFINGEHLDYEKEEDFWRALDRLVINTLDLPSAGEFMLTGEGKIHQEGNAIVITYSSAYKTVVDYDEEAQVVIYEEEEKTVGQEVLIEL